MNNPTHALTSKSFVHRFEDGTVCTMKVTAAGPVCEWSRRLKMTRRLRAEYLVWQRECLQTIADESGKRILQMVETRPGHWEILTVAPRSNVEKSAE